MSGSLRPLVVDDVPAAMALVRQVGWNQTPSDWMRFLRVQPDGCFAATADGRLVGSVTTIVYELGDDSAHGARHRLPTASIDQRVIQSSSLAWIGMLIVDAAHRGAGLGSRLLVRALEFLDRMGIACVKLDATPEGKGLYEHHGFVAEQNIERWALERTPLPQAREPKQIAPTIEDIILVDRQLFGADRGDLLRSISAEAPDLTVELRAGGTLVAYGCGRRGARADHLGPWMAHDAPAAEQVLRSFCERSDRPRLFVDALKSNPWSCPVLEANGFRLSRPLTRMYRGAPGAQGDTRRLAAIVGPEFG
jgi:GNAT superfamily N-acetyltransferase